MTTDYNQRTQKAARGEAVPQQPRRPVERPSAETVTVHRGYAPYIWAITRIALGFVFLWAFLDKTFGLHIATPTADAWIRGGSPTEGYLASLEGSFADQFSWMAGDAWADWLFMIGLLGIGVALILGVFMRIAAVAGAVLVMLMWLTAWPLENNPVIDDHVIYALVLLGLAASSAGDTWGLGNVWKRIGFVRRHPSLQ